MMPILCHNTGVRCASCVFSLKCVRFIVHYIIILHWNWVPLYEKRDRDLTHDWLSDERWIFSTLEVDLNIFKYVPRGKWFEWGWKVFDIIVIKCFYNSGL